MLNGDVMRAGLAACRIEARVRDARRRLALLA
jgi:hypothetical protein